MPTRMIERSRLFDALYVVTMSFDKCSRDVMGSRKGGWRRFAAFPSVDTCHQSQTDNVC